MYKWIAFINNTTNDILTKISIDGVFPEELKETRNLLAYEKNIPPSDIRIEVC